MYKNMFQSTKFDMWFVIFFLFHVNKLLSNSIIQFKLYKFYNKLFIAKLQQILIKPQQTLKDNFLKIKLYKSFTTFLPIAIINFNTSRKHFVQSTYLCQQATASHYMILLFYTFNHKYLNFNELVVMSLPYAQLQGIFLSCIIL